jgi:hypothetical protein
MRGWKGRMPMLREVPEGPDDGLDGPGTTAGAPPGRLAWARPGAAAAGLSALIRRNWLFAAALVLGVIPRVIAMLGYQPAMLFKLDTYDYLWDAAHLQPNPVNPNGYSLFLWVLRPFHSLALIACWSTRCCGGWRSGRGSPPWPR